MITQAELLDYFTYNPDTGIFIRRKAAKKGKSKAGDFCGYVENTGYSAFNACGRKYLAHRLAWLYVYGEFPEGMIDHINGNKTDNRIHNLRVVTNGENQQNIHRPSANNKSGLLGVSRNKKRWKAEIRANNMREHIGTFDSPEQAHAAYMERKMDLHINGGEKW